MQNTKKELTIDELVQVAGISKRTLKYYIQLGLVDRPIGETVSARYTINHIEQLKTVKNLQSQGFSLSRIASLRQANLQIPAKSSKRTLKAPGSPIPKIEVQVHNRVSVVFTQIKPELPDELINQLSKKIFDLTNQEIEEFEQQQKEKEKAKTVTRKKRKPSSPKA